MSGEKEEGQSQVERLIDETLSQIPRVEVLETQGIEYLISGMNRGRLLDIILQGSPGVAWGIMNGVDPLILVVALMAKIQELKGSTIAQQLQERAKQQFRTEAIKISPEVQQFSDELQSYLDGPCDGPNDVEALELLGDFGSDLP